MITRRTAAVAGLAASCLGVLGTGVTVAVTAGPAVTTTAAGSYSCNATACTPPTNPSPTQQEEQRVSEEMQQLILGLENKPGGVGPTSAVVEILGNILPSQL